MPRKFAITLQYMTRQTHIVAADTVEEARQVILDADWGRQEMWGTPFADPGQGIQVIQEVEINDD